MTTLNEAYQAWLGSKKSVNTRDKYEFVSNDFADKLFSKKANDIAAEDLNSLSYSLVFKKYIKPLRFAGYKDSTIKNYMTAVKSYIDMMSRDDVFDNVNFDKIKKDYISTNDLNGKDGGHNELLTEKEIMDLEKFAKNKKYNKDLQNKRGVQYAMLIDLMFRTAIRSTAVFTIKWSDFTIHNSAYDGKDWASLTVFDKGHKLNKKEITIEYYNNLRDLMFPGQGDGYVFGELNQRMLKKILSDFAEEIGRPVSVHSIKVGAATTLWARTKDILKVKNFCDHESVTTTERYIRDYGSEADEGTAIMMRDYDYSKLDNLTKEQLLALLHSRREIESVAMTEAEKMGMVKA